MNNKPSQYTPISCEFHDRLEDLATLRKLTSIRYLDDDHEPQQRNAIITDVYARDHAEYVSLSSGEIVRLDQLVEVDGVELASFPAHCELK
jgi:Rho-binding antiterminator